MEDGDVLANSENFGTVTVCPGGVVHIHLHHVSLKFVPEDFVRFSELIAQARLKFDLPRRGDGKPRLHVVSGESKPDPSPDGEE